MYPPHWEWHILTIYRNIHKSRYTTYGPKALTTNTHQGSKHSTERYLQTFGETQKGGKRNEIDIECVLLARMDSYSGQKASSVPRHTSSARQTQRGLAGVSVCVSHTHTNTRSPLSLTNAYILSFTVSHSPCPVGSQSLLCTHHLLHSLSRLLYCSYTKFLSHSLSHSLSYTAPLSHTQCHTHRVS